MKTCFLKKRIFFICLFLVTAPYVYALPTSFTYISPKKIDVLFKELKKTDSDKRKMLLLKDISTYLALNCPNKTALEYIARTADLAKKMKNEKISIYAMLLYGKIYIEENEIKKAFFQLDKALNLSKEFSYKNLIGKSLLMMSYFYKRLGFLEYSLEFAFKADQYMKYMNNYEKFYFYIGLGDIYAKLNEHANSIETYTEALNIAVDNNIKNLIALSITKISSIYISMGDYTKSLSYLNRAMSFYEKNSSSVFLRVFILFKFGKVYTKLGKLEKAFCYFEKALKISKRNDFKYYATTAIIEISNILILQKKYHKALFYLGKCKKYINKSSTLYGTQLKLYNTFSDYFEAVAEYKKALEYKKKCDVIKDKLFFDKVANRVALLETAFRHEQNVKNNQLLRKSIELKEERIKSDRHFILFLILITSLVLLLAVLFVVLYYSKKKFISKLNDLNRVLEEKVQDRTATLRKTVDNLSSEVKARKKLQELVEKISEREQQRIGHDIHDSIGQILVGISLGSQALVKKLKKRRLNDLSEEASKIVQNASQASVQARDLAKLLAPVDLREGGLEDAINRLVAFIKTNYNIECNLIIKDNENVKLSNRFVTNIYRIVQESVNNAVKHSQADNIDITIDLTTKPAIISVKDNGKGFLLKNSMKLTGMGIKIMETRSRLLNGYLKIDSKLNEGTVIKCIFTPDEKNYNNLEE
ncbi:MAG: sensor histidine kinase [Victivallales bacterium]|nr:sensor histidine kinase [Victivallales bacterium]MCF7888541.1 sensor histidine kinase [Victivallales bacterium]